jgi:hypothetical protein
MTGELGYKRGKFLLALIWQHSNDTPAAQQQEKL